MAGSITEKIKQINVRGDMSRTESVIFIYTDFSSEKNGGRKTIKYL